jgi:predicted nicotinamide N-methyase
MPTLGSRSFAITADPTGRQIDIYISEKAGVQADNLSLATWGSSFILSNILYRYTDHLREDAQDAHTIPILELGAGTGLVGLSAALIWKRPVILTDLAPILPGLAANLNVNAKQLAAAGVDPSCGTLDWTSPTKLFVVQPGRANMVLDAATAKAQVIMAADTCYSDEHPELMTQTILAWLAPGPTARVFITYAQRVAYLDAIRELWERLEAAGLECFDYGVEKGEEHWDESAPFEWTVWRWRS